MVRTLVIGLWMAVGTAVIGRSGLMIENLALRQQLIVLGRERPRPPIHPLDRLFWVLLRRRWSNWKSCLLIVDPDTVVAWHRRGFDMGLERCSSLPAFNSRFREEFLNRELFASELEAKVLSGEWRQDYNQARPHSALG